MLIPEPLITGNINFHKLDILYLAHSEIWCSLNIIIVLEKYVTLSYAAYFYRCEYV